MFNKKPNRRDDVARKTLKNAIVYDGRETQFTITPLDPQITDAISTYRYPEDLESNSLGLLSSRRMEFVKWC